MNVDATFYGIESLLESMKNYDTQDKRLFVVQSEYYGQGWGWIEGFPDKIHAKDWKHGPPIVNPKL
jgi:hypothetical protein